MELEIGKIYFCGWYSIENTFIFEATENKLCKAIRIKDNVFMIDSVLSQKSSLSNRKNTREATNKEKQWLEACIAANKFVPLSEIKEETNLLNSFQLF